MINTTTRQLLKIPPINLDEVQFQIDLAKLAIFRVNMVLKELKGEHDV